MEGEFLAACAMIYLYPVHVAATRYRTDSSKYKPCCRSSQKFFNRATLPTPCTCHRLCVLGALRPRVKPLRCALGPRFKRAEIVRFSPDLGTNCQQNWIYEANFTCLVAIQ